jgi:hypothetical protein
MSACRLPRWQNTGFDPQLDRAQRYPQALSSFPGRQNIVIRRAFSHAAAKTCVPVKMAQANRHAQKNWKNNQTLNIRGQFRIHDQLLHSTAFPQR